MVLMKQTGFGLELWDLRLSLELKISECCLRKN